MLTLKKYTREGFTAITQLGSAFFYIILITFLLTIGKVKLAFYLGAGLVACYIFVFVLRLFYFKDRPEKEDYYNLFTKINASSFPSMHTASAVYTAIVISNEIGKPLTTTFLILISLLIGYSRIYLKKHYFIDVLFGFLLGFIFGMSYLLL